MNENITIIKNIKTITWGLIILAGITAFSGLAGLGSLVGMSAANLVNETIDMPIDEFELQAAMTAGIIMSLFKLLVSAVVLTAAINMLNYKEWARSLMIKCLYVIIIYSLLEPVVSILVMPDFDVDNRLSVWINAATTISIIWTVIVAIGVSVGAVFVIRYLNKEKTVALFNSNVAKPE